jgi:hypothetical protein
MENLKTKINLLNESSFEDDFINDEKFVDPATSFDEDYDSHEKITIASSIQFEK